MTCRKEYKSEYKKRFRPFSQYEYVDGKFFKKRGDHEIGDPWYKEVIELRKKAGEYKVSICNNILCRIVEDRTTFALDISFAKIDRRTSLSKKSADKKNKACKTSTLTNTNEISRSNCMDCDSDKSRSHVVFFSIFIICVYMCTYHLDISKF